MLTPSHFLGWEPLRRRLRTPGRVDFDSGATGAAGAVSDLHGFGKLPFSTQVQAGGDICRVMSSPVLDTSQGAAKFRRMDTNLPP
jgi:hypothetical protein